MNILLVALGIYLALSFFACAVVISGSVLSSRASQAMEQRAQSSIQSFEVDPLRKDDLSQETARA